MKTNISLQIRAVARFTLSAYSFDDIFNRNGPDHPAHPGSLMRVILAFQCIFLVYIDSVYQEVSPDHIMRVYTPKMNRLKIFETFEMKFQCFNILNKNLSGKTQCGFKRKQYTYMFREKPVYATTSMR